MQERTKKIIAGIAHVLDEIEQGHRFAVVGAIIETDERNVDPASVFQSKASAVAASVHLVRALLLILKSADFEELADDFGNAASRLSLEYLAFSRQGAFPTDNGKAGGNGEANQSR